MIDEIKNYLDKLNIRSDKREYQTPGNTSCNILFIKCYPDSWVTSRNLEELLQVKFPKINYKKSLNDITIYDTVFSC